MIEPLRFHKEVAFAYEIHRPAFCTSCLSQKHLRSNPNIAIKYCTECPATMGHQKDFGAYLCKVCDDLIHDKGGCKLHTRQILVVGPGVRKKVNVRGDAVNFPLPLDIVKIRLKSRIYHSGKRIHKESAQNITFTVGTSGKTLHVQVLGARNLIAGDLGGNSDPFVVYSFCGRTLGSTRVRPRSLNPRWDNETFIVPMDESLPPPRGMVASQRDLFKLEVFNHDWFSSSEFLGHLEISKSKLAKMAVVANQQPIRLPLTVKEFHGSAYIRVGFNRDYFFVRVLRAESLDKQDAVLLSDPYVKVFLGFDNVHVGTTTVCRGTIDPEWVGPAGEDLANRNEFRVRIEQLLLTEAHIRSNIEINRQRMQEEGHSSRSVNTCNNEFNEFSEHLSLLRLEVYSHRRLAKHTLLGKCSVSCDDLRHMLPTLPLGSAYDLDAFAAELKRSSLHKAVYGSGDSVGLQQSTSEWLSHMARLFYAPRNKFSRSNAPVRRSSIDFINRRWRSAAGFDEEDNGDDVGSDASPFTPRDAQTTADNGHVQEPDLERNPDNQTGQEDPLVERGENGDEEGNVYGGTPNPTVSSSLTRSKSGKHFLLRSLSVLQPRRTLLERLTSGPTTWSGVHPVNVLKDSAKAMATKAARSLSNGQIILRLLPSNRGSVVVGLDAAVQQMSLGERATVKCRYDHAYSNYSMGGSIPPRANVVFTVELLEINGRGRIGVFWRMLKRFMRWLTTLLTAWLTCLAGGNTGKASKRSKRHHHRHRQIQSWSAKMQSMLGLSSKGGDGGDDDEKYSDDSENSSDEDSNGDSGSDWGEGAEDRQFDRGEVEGALALQQRPLRIKPDPRMKPHLTPSVKAGSSLMWGYVPPPTHPPPQSKAERRLSRQSSREVSLRRIAEGGNPETEENKSVLGDDEKEWGEGSGDEASSRGSAET